MGLDESDSRIITVLLLSGVLIPEYLCQIETHQFLDLSSTKMPYDLGLAVCSLGLIFHLSFEKNIIMPPIYTVPWLLKGLRSLA